MLWFERQEGRGKLNTFSLGHSQLRASVHSIHGGKKSLKILVSLSTTISKFLVLTWFHPTMLQF